MERPRETRAEAIVTQYTEVTQALDRLFRVMSPRIKYELWKWAKPDDPYHLVGSCAGQDQESSEQKLKGLAKKTLIELREERNSQTPGSSELTECPYHRTEGGCVLKELKSPYCIGHIDSPKELDQRFGFSGWGLVHAIHDNLGQILSARTRAEIESNAVVAAKFREDMDDLAAYIETFPMVLPELPKIPPPG